MPGFIIALDALHDFVTSSADAVIQHLSSEDVELNFHLVQSGGVGRREVQRHAALAVNSAHDLLVLVDIQVAHDDVQRIPMDFRQIKLKYL